MNHPWITRMLADILFIILISCSLITEAIFFGSQGCGANCHPNVRTVQTSASATQVARLPMQAISVPRYVAQPAQYLNAPQQYSSSETGFPPRQYYSSEPGFPPRQYSSSEPGFVPQQHSSSEAGSGPQRYSSSEPDLQPKQYSLSKSMVQSEPNSAEAQHENLITETSPKSLIQMIKVAPSDNSPLPAVTPIVPVNNPIYDDIPETQREVLPASNSIAENNFQRRTHDSPTVKMDNLEQSEKDILQLYKKIKSLKNRNKDIESTMGTLGNDIKFKCNDKMMHEAISKNIDSDPAIAKRQIQAAVSERIGGNIDTICSTSTFTYLVNTELYCELETPSITCLVFRQVS